MTPVEIALDGEIDLVAADDLKARLVEVTDEAICRRVPLRIDLADVTFLDSSGVACLASVLGRLRREEIPLQLVRVPAPIHRVLVLVGLDQACEIEPL